MNIQAPNLRPLKAGEILDRAFQLYRAHFRLFVVIAGITLLPLLVLELLSLYFFKQASIVTFVQSLLTIYLVHGALIWAASRAYLGLPVSINDSYRQARQSFGSFFGANFLQGFAYIPAGILVVVGTAGGLPGLILIGMLAMPYILFFATRWGLSFPAIMLEKLDSSRGLGKSWSLTSKDFWHVFITLIAAGLLSYLVVALPTVMIVYAMEFVEPIRTVGPSLSSVFTQVGTIISTPLVQIILVITYYDMRVRREGYDLELALQATEKTPEPATKVDSPDAA